MGIFHIYNKILNKRLYHADRELVDKLQPYAVDIGNKFQNPGWSLFCFDKKEYAIGYMLELLIEDIFDDLKMEYGDIDYAYDIINNRPLCTKESFKILKNYINTHDKLYGYVYTIDHPIYKIGIGNDIGLKEFTIRDKDIIPTECMKVTLDEKTLEDITVVSKIEYDKYIYDLKNNPKKYYRLLSIFMVSDHKSKMIAKRNIKNLIKSGKLKYGDDMGKLKDYL